MVFLCWNLNRRPLQQLVAELVRSKEVDVVILLECYVDVADVLQSLYAATGQPFYFSYSREQMKTIRVFTRFSLSSFGLRSSAAVIPFATLRFHRQTSYSLWSTSEVSFIKERSARPKKALY